MINFITLDLSLLVIFILFVSFFLYTHKKNLKREGIIYLYRTKLGMRFIEKTGKNYSKILKPLQYVIIACGFVLMTAMVYLLIKTLFFYFHQPSSSPLAKVPAVFPLIPYFPQIFNLQSFFPPFYFTYFIISIAIVAIVHEFSHGIFARLNNIKIHSTGFAFFGPFIGAFVEQDDKQMQNAKKFPQLSILAAGTFANLITAVFFILFIAVFFSFAYSEAGFTFDTYASSVINISDISSISNSTIFSANLNQINTSGATYFVDPLLLTYALYQNSTKILVFDNAPAIQSGLKGAITEIDSAPIRSQKDVQNILSQRSPGETIAIKTFFNNSVLEYSIVLGSKEGRAFLGIGNYPSSASGFSKIIYNSIASIKRPDTFYVSKIGDIADFIYDLLWWIIIINLLVALFNMFPAGILDGGRFLLLTVWGITKSKKLGEYSLKFMTWLLLIVVALMMVRWVFAIL